MEAFVAFFVLVFGTIVCLFVVIAVLGVGIYMLNRRVLIPAVTGAVPAEKTIEDWADEHDYEILALERIRNRDHPFADRFGFGVGKMPGLVYEVEVRTQSGRKRLGWIYLRLGLFGQPLSESLEVRWDE